MAEVYINIHFYDEYTRENIHHPAERIPKVSNDAQSGGCEWKRVEEGWFKVCRVASRCTASRNGGIRKRIQGRCIVFLARYLA